MRKLLLAAALTAAAALCLGASSGPVLSGQTAANAASAVSNDNDQEKKQVAIVIDDFGNNMSGTAEMLDLPVKITAAVMPFLPSTKKDAELAHLKGHDVIVHMPMEPNHGKKEWLGPGALLSTMSDAEIKQRVEAAIDDVPHAIGMNNHMGSKITADKRIVRILLSVIKERGMFFLDSRTTHKTVVAEVARELDVPVVNNDVFLDDQYTMLHIMKQVGQMKKHLENHPTCVVIGHVGPPGRKTSKALEQTIPQMKEKAQFVRLSQLVEPSLEKEIIPHA